ncbi:MAG: hypothetical protein ABS46_20200 [Cytophagaceae bacterium SCN 52-12]|nr:MAG: hypothetical protein ABS46_20200 [Cytophagaceae bacterium SCN 52-12]
MIVAKSLNYTLSGKRAGKIPSYLVHEVLDGEPVYYKGYREVLAGARTLEEIIGSSTLQTAIVEYLLGACFSSRFRKRYRIITNEGGLHLDKRNNLAGDIELFDPAKLPVSTADLHYATVPPEIHLEVDVNTEMEHFTDEQYIAKKTTKLLEFGVKKVIWILSSSKTIIIAARDADRQVVDWAEDVEVADGILINVGRYLKEQGSPFA